MRRFVLVGCLLACAPALAQDGYTTLGDAMAVGQALYPAGVRLIFGNMDWGSGDPADWNYVGPDAAIAGDAMVADGVWHLRPGFNIWDYDGTVPTVCPDQYNVIVGTLISQEWFYGDDGKLTGTAVFRERPEATEFLEPVEIELYLGDPAQDPATMQKLDALRTAIKYDDWRDLWGFQTFWIAEPGTFGEQRYKTVVRMVYPDEKIFIDGQDRYYPNRGWWDFPGDDGHHFDENGNFIADIAMEFEVTRSACP